MEVKFFSEWRVVMQTDGSLICPYIKGSLEGALCRIENRSVKDMADADIHVCMSEHFEFCPVQVLQRGR